MRHKYVLGYGIGSASYSRCVRSLNIEGAPRHLADASGGWAVRIRVGVQERPLDVGRRREGQFGSRWAVDPKILAGSDMIQPKEIESRINSHFARLPVRGPLSGWNLPFLNLFFSSQHGLWSRGQTVSAGPGPMPLSLSSVTQLRQPRADAFLFYL